MINFFWHKPKTRLIPDPDFPPLHALNLDPDDQNELLKSSVEVWQTAQNLGKTTFSLQQAHDYYQKIGRIRSFLWLWMLGICAWVNVNAVRATIDNSLPAQLYLWKPFVTFALSLFLVFLLDWLIGSEIKKYLCWFDAFQNEAKLTQSVHNAPGELNRAFALGQQQEAFDRVQKRYLYLSEEKYLSRIKMAFLVVVYLIEIIAALHSITLYGESKDLTAYLAPLLAVLFSGLSGVFRGITIEYPKIRHKICTRYVHLAEEKPLDGLKREIQVANTITAVFLQQRSLRRETVEQIQQSVRTAEDNETLMENLDQLAERFHAKSQGLHQQYQTDLNAWEDKFSTWQENGRSINPERQRQRLQQARNRLTRLHLEEQRRLIASVQQQVNSLYRRHPTQSAADCPFGQELRERCANIDTETSRLILEEQILNAAPPSPFRAPSQEQADDQDKPFDVA